MNKTTLSFTIVLLVLGLFISMQFKTQQDMLNSIVHQDATTLFNVNQEMLIREAELSETLQDLLQQRSELALEATSVEELIYQTRRESEQLKLLSGEVPVSGPGITVTITRDAPLWHLDLVDLVNELWASGAEAIAINDHRVIFNTHIQVNLLDEFLVDSESLLFPIEILVNNEVLLFPIVVTAIGNSHTLEAALNLTGGLMDVWRIEHRINPTIVVRDRVTIPAVNIHETIHRL